MNALTAAPEVMHEEVVVPDGVSMFGFVAAALIVLLIPGPGVLYIVARSLSQGRAGCSMEPLKYAPAPPDVSDRFGA